MIKSDYTHCMRFINEIRNDKSENSNRWDSLRTILLNVPPNPPNLDMHNITINLPSKLKIYYTLDRKLYREYKKCRKITKIEYD